MIMCWPRRCTPWQRATTTWPSSTDTPELLPGGTLRLQQCGLRRPGHARRTSRRHRLRRPAQQRVCGLGRHDRHRLPAFGHASGADLTGYLDVQGHRSNVLHLPVRGSGDGGAKHDRRRRSPTLDRLAGRCRSDRTVLAAAWQPLSDVPRVQPLWPGFWLHATGAGDARRLRRRRLLPHRARPRPDTTHTVIANWSNGAWP